MNASYFLILFLFLFVFQIPAFLTIFIAYPIKIIFDILGLTFDHTQITNYLVRVGFYVTDKLFFRTEHVTLNSNNDLRSKRYVYMANHQSYIDPIIGSVIKIKTIIPVAGYLKYIPLLGYNAVFSGLPLVKYTPKKDKSPGITQQMIDILTHDPKTALTMFPEGQRNFLDDFKLQDIRTGGFVVALNVGIDILPIYHNIMDRFNDDKMEYRSDKKIYCVWGEPISVSGKTIDQLKNEYYESMKKLQDYCDKLRGIQNRLPLVEKSNSKIE